MNVLETKSYVGGGYLASSKGKKFNTTDEILIDLEDTAKKVLNLINEIKQRVIR